MREHEFVANTAKVDPHMRKLMREERTRVKQFTIIDFLPLIGRAIGRITLGGQRMRRRTKSKDIQKQTFVITLVSVWNESILRSPAMG
jgi:hypothetical protein